MYEFLPSTRLLWEKAEQRKMSGKKAKRRKLSEKSGTGGNPGSESVRGNSIKRFGKKCSW